LSFIAAVGDIVAMFIIVINFANCSCIEHNDSIDLQQSFQLKGRKTYA